MFGGFRRMPVIATILAAIGVSASAPVPSPTHGPSLPEPEVRRATSHGRTKFRTWGAHTPSPYETARRRTRRRMEKEGRKNARRWL
jgi:hypothetical protein